MGRKILGAIIILGYSSAAIAQTAEGSPDERFASIPNVALSYYDVSGSDAAKIRTAINKLRPTDRIEKRAFDGRTDYKFDWRWPVNGTGKCDLERAKVEYRATVTLPRLANYATLPARLQKRWDYYFSALKEHEVGHVLLSYEQKDKLLVAIQGATCDTVNEVAKNLLGEVSKLNQDYDEKTQHGRTQGATFP